MKTHLWTQETLAKLSHHLGNLRQNAADSLDCGPFWRATHDLPMEQEFTFEFWDLQCAGKYNRPSKCTHCNKTATILIEWKERIYPSEMFHAELGRGGRGRLPYLARNYATHCYMECMTFEHWNNMPKNKPHVNQEGVANTKRRRVEVSAVNLLPVHTSNSWLITTELIAIFHHTPRSSQEIAKRDEDDEESMEAESADEVRLVHRLKVYNNIDFFHSRRIIRPGFSVITRNHCWGYTGVTHQALSEIRLSLSFVY